MLVLLESAPTSLFHKILQVDYQLMVWVNKDLSSPLLDVLTLFMRESIFHIPIYVFIIVFVFNQIGKTAWWWILGGITLISISDLLSSFFIKSYFNRPRPCRDPYIMYQINVLAKYCGANGSFTSSHAMNHFAFASYVYFTFRRFSSYFSLLFIWAAFISFSQVYVGVHYPSDVLCGGLLGCSFGWIAARIAEQSLSLHHYTV